MMAGFSRWDIEEESFEALHSQFIISQNAKPVYKHNNDCDDNLDFNDMIKQMGPLM